MMEFLNSLTWQAAFAIVGSIVTIVIGIFGYLKGIKPSSYTSSSTKVQRTDLENLHSRITAAKELSYENKVEVRALTNAVRAIEKQMADHERRDIEDFKNVNAKVDKLMDIVIQILQDDKL